MKLWHRDNKNEPFRLIEKKFTVISDFNNCITDRPELFRCFKELTVVTGMWEGRRQDVEKRLKDLKINYSELVMCPLNWGVPSEYFKSKKWKIETIAKLKPDVFIDDNLRTILAVKTQSPKTTGLLLLENGYKEVTE